MSIIPKIILAGLLVGSAGIAIWRHGKRVPATTFHCGAVLLAMVAEVSLLIWAGVWS